MTDLQAITEEITKLFVKENVSARESLVILRMLENDALLILLLDQLATISKETEDKQ